MSALLLFVFVLGAAAFVVYAANDVETKGIVQCNAADGSCNLCELFHTVMRVVNFCIKTLIPLVAAMLIAFGGFKMIVNPGNVDAATQAKAIITAAIVGLMIIYGGWALVDMFMQRMNYNPGVKWYDVPCTMPTSQVLTPARGV